MSQWFRRFRAEEEGQDIIEYSLLITFIAIACMWFVGSGRNAVNGVWTSANSTVVNAQTAADGGRVHSD